MARRDIEIRDKLIMKFYRAGVARKQIPLFLDWLPKMTYEAIRKVIQKRSGERRAVPRPGPDRRRGA